MEEVRDEDLKFVTITGCDTSSDYSYCKVYFTVLDEEKREVILEALDGASSFIRSKLAERIDIRHTPELKFIYDTRTTNIYTFYIHDALPIINSKISDIDDLATMEQIEKMTPYNKNGKLKTKKLSERHFNLLRYAQGDNYMLKLLGVEW